MDHLGVLKNLKRVCAFQIELEFGSVVFLKEKEQLESPEETSQSKGENQHQT